MILNDQHVLPSHDAGCIPVKAALAHNGKSGCTMSCAALLRQSSDSFHGVMLQVASSPATASPADPALAAISLPSVCVSPRADRQTGRTCRGGLTCCRRRLLRATAHPASPQLLQILVKAEELVLCLQAASPHKMVCLFHAHPPPPLPPPLPSCPPHFLLPL